MCDVTLLVYSLRAFFFVLFCLETRNIWGNCVVRKMCDRLKMSSCPGYDGIPTEMWKSFTENEQGMGIWWTCLIEY
jgi:hypothetical protein